MNEKMLISSLAVVIVVLLAIIAAMAVLLALYRSRCEYLERRGRKDRRKAKAAALRLRRMKSVQCLTDARAEDEIQHLTDELRAKTILLRGCEKQLFPERFKEDPA